MSVHWILFVTVAVVWTYCFYRGFRHIPANIRALRSNRRYDEGVTVAIAQRDYVRSQQLLDAWGASLDACRARQREALPWIVATCVAVVTLLVMGFAS